MLHSIFGGSRAKILDALLESEYPDESYTSIQRKSGLSYKTVVTEMPDLCELGVVEITRDVGKSKMVRLNTNSKLARALRQLVNDSDNNSNNNSDNDLDNDLDNDSDDVG